MFGEWMSDLVGLFIILGQVVAITALIISNKNDVKHVEEDQAEIKQRLKNIETTQEQILKEVGRLQGRVDRAE